MLYVNEQPRLIDVRDYAPPADSLPDPPEIVGKWRPQYTRDKKSYIVPGLDGVRETQVFTRATSLAKTLDDTTALMDWKMQATLLGLVRTPEMLDEVDVGTAAHLSELDRSEKWELNGLARRAARTVGADDAATFGTKLHNYLEAVLEGVIAVDDVPDMLKPYMTVLFAAMRDSGLSFVGKMVERTVFIPATGMVGTLDFLMVNTAGTLMVGDLKTSGSIDFSWLSIAVQLAQYANATMMLSWDGSRWEQMPPVSKVVAKVASVPKDAPNTSCRIYSVNLELGSELMHVATRVNKLRECALRCASYPEQLREGDEPLAWADAQPVTALTAA